MEHAFFESLRRTLLERFAQRAPTDIPHGVRASAVLAPLYWADGEPWTLLIRRPDTLRKHPGQLAFPGGGREQADATLLHTALRESQEELGLAPTAVDVLGGLSPFPTFTGFHITPFVGRIPVGLELQPSAEEVSAILHAPLYRLTHVRADVHPVMKDAFAIPGNSQVVWGATYHMLKELLALLPPR